MNELKRTYSLNLIAWLRSHGVEVTVHFENHRIFGVYEESTKTILLKQMYREDEELHRFLNEFKMLKQTK
ncbi:MAG: hypothetical protein J6F30_18200 [Cellulosilyticum sp.]|nr:hypothetical protein [Cellulosilyticum sp.]